MQHEFTSNQSQKQETVTITATSAREVRATLYDCACIYALVSDVTQAHASGNILSDDGLQGLSQMAKLMASRCFESHYQASQNLAQN